MLYPMIKLHLKYHDEDMRYPNMGFIARKPDKSTHTGPLKKLIHYAIFQKFFHILILFNSLCFTIHVIN